MPHWLIMPRNFMGLLAHFSFLGSFRINLGNKMDRQSQIRECIEPAVKVAGCELWGIEYLSQGRHATLRIFIEKDEGVQVEDCERVSKQVSAVLDVEDPIQSAYTLEVSSPGADRYLFEKAQYERFLGEQVKVRLRANFDGRRNYSGTLVAVEDDAAVLRVDNEEFVFPIEGIDKAQIVPNFG